MANAPNKIDILIKVFENQQTLISNADGKANISLGIQTFLMTTVFGASMIVNTFNSIANLNCIVIIAYYILFGLFLISSIVGLSFCILVFTPRPPQEIKEVNRKGITYFGHISKFKNSDEYLETIKNTEANALLDEFAFQNYSLAIILTHKMGYVRKSTTLLFINILLGISLLLFSILVK
jgi:hypothetical protein